jgi:hypothetical protein
MAISEYCISLEFSAWSYQTRSTLEMVLLFCTLGMLVVAGLYIIYKMCLLCKIAYSYSHFYVHEAYKFYTLALISTMSTPDVIPISAAHQPGSSDPLRLHDQGQRPVNGLLRGLGAAQ